LREESFRRRRKEKKKGRPHQNIKLKTKIRSPLRQEKGGDLRKSSRESGRILNDA